MLMFLDYQCEWDDNGSPEGYAAVSNERLHGTVVASGHGRERVVDPELVSSI
jgi:hypothetical protein